MKYDDILSESNDVMMLEEPVYNIAVENTCKFLDKHYNSDFTPEQIMEWEDFDSVMKERIHRMFDEKKSRTIA